MDGCDCRSASLAGVGVCISKYSHGSIVSHAACAKVWMPFTIFQGNADLHQNMHQWVMSFYFGKCSSMSPGSSAWYPGARGAGADAS